jgi:hypothetical protein
MQENGELAKAGNPQLLHRVTFKLDDININKVYLHRWRKLEAIAKVGNPQWSHDETIKLGDINIHKRQIHRWRKLNAKAEDGRPEKGSHGVTLIDIVLSRNVCAHLRSRLLLDIIEAFLISYWCHRSNRHVERLEAK